MDPDWANLPKHLLDSVVKRLALPSDYLQFSCVCKSWCSVAKDNKSQRSKMITPMLLISANKKHTWHLYRVMDNKILDLQVSVPNKRYCGFSKGWLITLENNFIVALINPFFRVKGKQKKENSIIRLPPLTCKDLTPRRILHWSRRSESYGVKAMISADPVLNASDCIVVIIYEELKQMAFIRLSKDTTWTYIDRSADNRGRLIEEVAYFRDRFYAVDYWRRLLSFDITAQSNSDIKLVAQSIEGKKFDKKYIVNSNEKELLMVQRYYSREDSSVTIGFKVFEFKFDKSEWVEKNDLGDVALFLGDNTSISVVTSSSSGCQSNSIYFCHDYNENDYGRRYCDCGVYDVKSQTITRYDIPLLKMTDRPAIWVVPSFHL
ncbi:F-box protein SKIP23 [Rosa sericea]